MRGGYVGSVYFDRCLKWYTQLIFINIFWVVFRGTLIKFMHNLKIPDWDS